MISVLLIVSYIIILMRYAGLPSEATFFYVLNVDKTC